MSDVINIVERDIWAELSARLSRLDSERAQIIAEMEALQPGSTLSKRQLPANHGKPWSKAEKAEIASLFSNGVDIREIADKQQRTRGSIRSELIRQGLIELEPPAEEAEPPKTQKREPAAAVAAPEEDNCKITTEFKQAFELLENTQANVFLTGRAGTGKSTFLHYFRKHSAKQIAVVAPTGVAALNVGAQTIHSFFRLKPGFVDVKALKPARTRVLRNLELLIIDEISMVRADMFDGIDRILKIARKNNAPFGGVQICAIGDLFQLPPVVTRDEKQIYSNFYSSPFFFCSKAYQEAKFTTIQFTTIHRQNDGAFIQILNAIRAGTCDAIELEALNSRLNPKASPAPGTLVLTTTNVLAEEINQKKLESLAGKMRSYKGEISGDFAMQGARLPSPEMLILKIGAQVMFVKNDRENRWVNGTIGIVQQLDDDIVTISIGDEIHEVERETWTSLGYELSKESGDIVEKTLGTYKQFPLLLAWAITIHKSQGKTLERVIIDLGNGAFAPGQLYVALSRCKSLSGIALKQPVTNKDISCNDEVVEFMKNIKVAE